MRTTLTIDDDALAAARTIAAQSSRTLGEVVSELVRRALRPAPAGRDRNGVPLLPVRTPGTIVTLEMVNALRDAAP